MSIVSIIGRANVGKSTLFNRLVGHRRSIVDDMPGVTRDRIFADIVLDAKKITLVDTGGLGFDPVDQISGKVGQQIQTAAEESDCVLFVVDGRAGLTNQDQEVVDLLRPLGKKVIVAVNKFDPSSRQLQQRDATLAEFYSMGLPVLCAVSAEHGTGIDELKKELLSVLAEIDRDSTAEPTDENAVRVAFMGRPNVGKSSLINRLLDEPRLIVSDEGGTTRDTVDVRLTFKEQPYVLLDTAGIRKRSKVSNRIETFSVIRSLKTIRQADVVALILDASENITTQDLRIASFILHYGPGVVLVVNKWDLVNDSDAARRHFREELWYRAPFLRFSEVKFVSAKSGQGVESILPSAKRIKRIVHQPLASEKLRDLFHAVFADIPAAVKASGLRFKSVSHKPGRPYLLLVKVSRPDLVTKEMERYFLNRFHEFLNLSGVPLRVKYERT